MNAYRRFSFVIVLSSFTCIGCNGQNQHRSQNPKRVDTVTPELYGTPQNIAPCDTSPGWAQRGPKLLITGTVFERDGKTPADEVLLYYYHATTEGLYQPKPGEKRSLSRNSRSQTHGYIRGWVRTGSDGKYSVYTVRPGVYPTHSEPARVHVTLTEPSAPKSYYIDDFVFDDDILLTGAKRKQMENRGGSGVLRLVRSGDLFIGERNIVLGLNIPYYPDKIKPALASGLSIGEDVLSFTPFHAWGPDKGTKVCPVCKYGWYHGILYFVGTKPDWRDIRLWLAYLETESRKREGYLKVYFIYGNEMQYAKSGREAELSKIGNDLNLRNVALTFVPSLMDRESDVFLNNINPQAENTFILYKRSNVFAKYVNLPAAPENFRMISAALDKNKNEYFDMPNLNNK